MTVGKLIIGLLIPILVAATYIESAGANAASSKKIHETFMPMVGFNCGFRNQYLSQDGVWTSDISRYATCMSGKLDILKYCKKAYPSLNITNIVEYSHEVSINGWCREEGNPCKWTHSIRPYMCIDGEFHSEALQVPHDCHFSHVNARDQCNDYKHWKEEAGKQCAAKRTKNDKPMTARSFAVLEPCAIDMFTGVEFVCCPNDQPAKKEVRKQKAVQADDDDDDDDTYEDDEDDEDTYEESDEDKDEETNQDPYFKAANWTHEHEEFKAAEQRMELRHRKKVEKVMKEWAQLEARYAQMKNKDPKGAERFKTSMSNRFQKTVASLEEEHKRMKKEIEAVHEERVGALLNEKKRDATHDYRQALSTHVNKPNKHNVLQSLKAYIRAEEKDRLHTLNRYRHMLRTDQDEAVAYKATVLHKLRYIDLRINGTLAMLRDFPDLEKYVRPIAIQYWKDFRTENTPELSDEDISALNTLDEDAKNKRLVDLYSEAFEKLHPSAKLDVKAPSTTEAPKEAEKVKELPKEASDSEEDDDEYYEDEDDEEVRKTSGGQQKVKVIDIKPKESKESLSVKKIVEAPKLVETSVQTDDSKDSTSSDESSDSDEEDEKNIKELRVDIEPIIEERPSFYRFQKLITKEATPLNSNEGRAPFVFFVLAVAIAVVGIFMVTAARRRRAMRGFIEVDVYTPEERHVAGMQVNGYENPTYSFFDSKA